MLRNYLWTGNPLFPLYDSFFNPKSSAEIADAPVRISHFIQRSVLYNESWWEILLIPLKIFFQGQDDSIKYFDGKLNPLLFFLPFFAFFQKKEKDSAIFLAEKKMLLAFAVLFLLFVFIRTDMRIRYIAPIIPPLVILSVLGFRELCRYVTARYPGKVYIFLTVLAVCSVMSLNAVYISDQIRYVDPCPISQGKYHAMTISENIGMNILYFSLSTGRSRKSQKYCAFLRGTGRITVTGKCFPT